eukprot:s1464_g6.t1
MRQFQEQDAKVRTWAGRAYTDDELSRRFENQSSGNEGLMDEEAARRLVARERESAQSDLMDEETVKSGGLRMFLLALPFHRDFEICQSGQATNP